MEKNETHMESSEKRPGKRYVLARSDRGGRLLAGPAAAQYMGLAYHTFMAAVRRGQIPKAQIPGSKYLLFDKRDLDRTIESWKLPAVASK
jgi:hypothetical protein